MNKNVNKKLKFKRWYVVIILVIVIVILIGIPFILGWLIPKQSPISNFSESNDWIGFFGSYMGGILGGLCTLIVMYFTLKDTREIQKENSNIQNKMIDQEKESILNENRTFIGYYKLMSDPFFTKYKKLYEGAMYILDEDAILTEKVLKMENEEACYADSFPNINLKMQKLTKILCSNEFGFWRVKNVGKNPMINFYISLKGQWLDEELKYVDDVEKSYNFAIVEDGQILIFPLFKINEKVEIYYFKVFEMTIKYDTGITGIVESNEIFVKFGENNSANSTINTDILKRNEFKTNIEIPMYRII